MDMNSLITNALDNANKRRAAAAGLTDKLLSKDGMAKASDQGLSEISVEDLANAMKSRNERKQVDNLFVERNGKDLHEKDEKQFGVNDVSMASSSHAVSNTHNKIAEVYNHSEKMINRQSEVFSEIRKVQNNPFVV